MKSKILVLMVLAAFSFLSIFGGCGGGGGGSRDDDDDDGNGGLSYTGETAPAEIDQDNAVDIAVGAFAGGKTGNPTSFDNQYAPGLPVDNFRYYKVPQILGDAARSMDLRPYLHNLSSNADAVYNETGTVEGTCGGSFDYTVNKNDVSGEFEGTIIFYYYCDHCVAINGDVDFEGRADPNSGDIITITFWFDNLSDGTMTMDGEISVDFSDSPIICTLDALFKDETTGNVYWAQNYSLNINEIFWSWQHVGTEVEIFGTFYHPDYGYVTVYTESVFFIPKNYGVFQIHLEWPMNGQFLLNGANDTKARLKATFAADILQSEYNAGCSIEADSDGDGSYDWNSGDLFWTKPDAIDPANWMGNLGDHIESLKIKNVVLPGTHDSNTDSKDWGPPGFKCASWSYGSLRAQSRSPRIQLNEGIRYFDLRYQWQGSGDELTDSNLVIWHGMCHTNNGPIQNAITWVKNFVESHPKEIIILDLNGWSFMNTARHRAAAEYIVERLGEYMVPWDIGPNPIKFASPDVTVQDLWEAKKNVIVIYRTNNLEKNRSSWYSPPTDPNRDYGSLFWAAEYKEAEPIIVTPWPNTNQIDILEREMKTALKCRSQIDDVLLECQPPDAHNKLFVLQSQLTGDPGKLYNELWRLAEYSNPLVIKWLQEWTTIGDDLIPTISPQDARENLNFVIVDFYHYEGGKDIHNSCRNKSFVETIVGLNLNRAPLFK